ncbi:hypothetical protein GQ53DRAFT_134129 [Thozetella sp. PMI_491]|nr:hypothetical protein GQ53DRAFT_134129 [Thozetella sp. PMI_491]
MRPQSLVRLAAIAALGVDAGPATNGTLCKPPRGEVGAVFALDNVPEDNRVIAFSRDASGKLTEVGQFSTGGRGQGVDFDTQGGLQLSADNRFLYAVSPADDKITVFRVQGSCLEKVQEVYAGDQPLSISLSGNGFAYALDGSVASTGIYGFKVDGSSGFLTALSNTTIATSTPIGVPGTVVFSPDGTSLIVTNKVGSSIDVFSVGPNGIAKGPITTSQSSGPRPFGAVFNKAGDLFVVESGLPSLNNAGLSTYHLTSEGQASLSPLTRSEKNLQTDGCWVVVTPNQQYAYTASFVTSAISSYAIGSDSTVKLLNGTAGLPGNTSEPVDLGLTKDGKFLYNLLRGTGAIAGWGIKEDGSLNFLGIFGEHQSLPANNGVSGLAVY